VKALRGVARFVAGDAPEMVPVVALVVGLAFALKGQGYAVAVLPIVVALAFVVSVTVRARRHWRSAATRGAGVRSVERQLAVGAAQAEGLDQ
jgi:hypothetical protein